MTRPLLFAALSSSWFAASLIGACSSSDNGGGTSSSGGSSTSSSSGGSSTSSSGGGSSSSSSSGSSSSGGSEDAGTGSFGVKCTNPINTPGSGSGGGGGGGGSSGATNPDGGKDPACVGVYDLCASVGASIMCTKPCTYTGTSGPQADPTDCPNPPTNGECTPRGFCQ